jgi:N-acetylmuramic acid 6-phosphate etherase
MVMERTGMKDYDQAKEILLQFGSVKKAVENLKM